MPLVKKITIDVLLSVMVVAVSVGVFAFIMHRSVIVSDYANQALSIARTEPNLVIRGA